MARDPPFVARDEELKRLRRFYSQALDGQATVCLVSGEPGAGKTALVEQFAAQLQNQDPAVVVLRGDCAAQTGAGDPYLPFRETLTQLAGDVDEEVERGRMSTENASRLRRIADLTAEVVVEQAPNLIDLFIPGGSLVARLGARMAPELPGDRETGTAAGEEEPSPAVPRSLDQERIFEQVTEVLQHLAGEQPLVLLLDDLHWADEASIGLLFHLVRRLGTAPVLLVGTYRPEEVAVGRGEERHPLDPVLDEIKRYEGDVWIDLDESPEESRRRLFQGLVDLEANRLDESFRETLYRRTEGNPLFTLELLRHLREEGYLDTDGEGRVTAETVPEWMGLPARVEGVIGKRLGMVDEQLREVLQVGSVEGDQFRVPIVARVLDREEQSLIRRLSGELEKKHQIVRAEGVRRVAGHRLATYRFRHNLFRTYLYESLDEVERTYLHEEVGEILEELFGDDSDEIASELAYHYEAADVPEKAVSYYEAAGEHALELYATEDAIRHFRKALEQVRLLPEGEARDRRELELQLRLGPCLVASEGYGSPETLSTYERAQELCERLGRPTDAPVLRALAVARIVKAKHAEALSLGEELMQKAEVEEEPVLIVEAHYVLGVANFWMGRFGPSRDNLEQAVEQYRPGKRAVHTDLYAQDPKVICLCRLGWTLWYLGRPEAGRRRIEESLTLARELEHPHSRAYALYFAAQYFVEVGELARAQDVLGELVTLTDERSVPHFRHRGLVTRGWVRAARGEEEAGIAQMRRSIGRYTERGDVVGVAQEYCRLAQIHLERGAIEDGFQALSEASAIVEETDEGYCEAELHRLEGELLLAEDGDSAEAEACFRRAREVARRQNALSLELRAATTLGCLWHEEGRTGEPREVLQRVFEQFSEGLGTADLERAHTLLNEWS